MHSPQSIEEAIKAYGHSIISKDYKKTIEFIYPKLFDYIPRKTIEDSLKSAYINKEVDVVLRDFKLDKIEFEGHIKELDYLIIQTSFFQKVRYLVSTEEAKEEARFHYEILSEKYGDFNVSFEEESNEISANSFSKQLAILENGCWKLLDINPSFIELYAKFLPTPITEALWNLFPTEEVSELELSDEEEDVPNRNIVLEISKDSSMKVIYLIGWEVFLNGDQDCTNFIATQITNKSTFERASQGLELIFKEDKLSFVNEYYDGEKVERPLKKEEIGLDYCPYPENKILNLVESANGPHQLGGEIPNDFALPENKCKVPFQYLGFIDKHDPNFNWLPFRFHLIFPIYLNVGKVFLDYSNPNKTVLINREEVERADTYYEELNEESKISFPKEQVVFTEDLEFEGTCHAGIPNWIQAPDIPLCPITGNRMRFLCQLNGGMGALPFEEMNFWGDGDLFVFFEPGSKIACYFIQNT